METGLIPLAHKILLTRPLPQGSVMAEQLEKAGWTVLYSPVMTLYPKPDMSPEIWMDVAAANAVILTSQYALELLHKAFPSFSGKLYITGSLLAKKAREYGYHHIIAASGNATSIIPVICQHERSDNRLIYLHGQHISQDLVQALKIQGYHNSKGYEIYTSKYIEHLSNEVYDALLSQEILAATCFSRLSALYLEKIIKESGMTDMLRSITAVCISDNIAMSLQQELWKGIVVADSPALQDIEKTLALLAGYSVC